MENFTYKNPTEIRFGENVVSELGDTVYEYGKTALFVYGMNSIKKSGLYKIIKEQLYAADIKIIECGGVQGNPTLEHTRSGIRKAIENKVDVIVAVGGGSVIDEAKAIAIGALGTDSWEVLCGNEEIKEAIPIISVQTLPATDSEMNGGFVITNSSTNEKFGTGGSVVTHPKVSFLDPSYTTSITLKQTAFAIADILSHLTEGYFTMETKNSTITQFYIEGIAKSVIDSARKIMSDPKNVEARGNLMWASSLAWNGTGVLGLHNASLPCHAFEHAISGIYPQVAHGAGLSVITPAWLEFVKDIYYENITKFGKNVLLLDTNNVSEIIEGLLRFYKEIGTPTSWKELGIIPDYSQLTKETVKLMDMWGIKTPNYSKKDIEHIFRLAE